MISLAWVKTRTHQSAWREAVIAWSSQHVVIVALMVLCRVMLRLPLAYTPSLFASFDGPWYLQIARSGYATPPDAAYFPLYPLLVHLLGGGLFAALLIANLFGLFAFVLFRILIEQESDQATARRALVYFACYPLTMILMASYTESVFLVFALLTFWALKRRQWDIAAIAAVLATLTRSTGILLILPIALEAWKELRAKTLLIVLPPIVALAVWEVLISLHFHTFPAITAAMNNVRWRRSLDWPWSGIIWDVQAIGHSPLVRESEAIRDLMFLLAWVAILIAMRGRLPRAYTAFSWACLLLVLCEPQHMIIGRALASIPRYMLVCFPVFFLLAHWGRRKSGHLSILFVELLLLSIMSIAFALGGFVG